MFSSLAPNLLLLAWLDETLRNFLWVPLTAYAKDIGTSASLLGAVFGINVGVRFFPNLLVTMFGVKVEFPLMLTVFAGFVVAGRWQSETWSLFVLAACAGMGFVRGCVTLHAQALYQGDLDALSAASRTCGAARAFASVCSYFVPTVVFDAAGWSAVMALGAFLSILYVIIAVPMHRHHRMLDRAARETGGSMLGCEVLVESADLAGGATAAEASAGAAGLRWIDWAISSAFVSTELQWNLLNTAFPAALVHGYAFRASVVGGVVAAGCLCAMGYLLALPSLPRIFNQRRPLNLLITYFGMSFAWIVMVIGLCLDLPWPFFVIGGYMFLINASGSQAVLLQCLTGVCDLEGSTRVMGVSEMFGSALGMGGSYAGSALQEYGLVAPFVACTYVSLLSAIFLTIALGLRRAELERRAPCALVRPDGLLNDDEAHAADDGPVAKTVSGLHSILVRTHSFINGEQSHRAGEVADMVRHVQLVPDADESAEPDPVNEDGAGGADQDDENVSIISSMAAPALRRVVSDHSEQSQSRAQRLKMLTVDFPHAFVDLEGPSLPTPRSEASIPLRAAADL